MRILLRIVSLFYGAAVRLRNAGYDSGLIPVRRVSVPVVCVGNLSVGGTGKTSVTLWCAETLLTAGLKPVILSRGYGREASESGTLVVPKEAGNAAEVRNMASRYGDEPVMLSRALPKVPVVVDADRVRGALAAIEQFKPDVILMDDGFQHRRLGRDLDILCFDEALFQAPFLFPRGYLREPLSGASRAGAAAMKSQNGKIIHPLELPTALYRYRVREVRDLAAGRSLGPEWLKGRRVLAACAIAHPENFEATLVQAGAEISDRAYYPDHLAFGEHEFEGLLDWAKKVDASIVMTAKDAVKFPARFPAFVAEAGIEWVSGEDVLKNKLLEAAKK